MSSSSTISRLAPFLGVSLLVVAISGCGTQGSPVAATDQISGPMISSESPAATQGGTSFQTEQATSLDSVEITISPNVLVLGSQGVWVTVHCDVPYSSVELSTIKLEGIDAASSFPDDRGDLVSKFKQTKIEEIVEPGEANLTLTGSYKNGEGFEGSDTIIVKKKEDGNNETRNNEEEGNKERRKEESNLSRTKP